MGGGGKKTGFDVKKKIFVKLGTGEYIEGDFFV